MMTAPPRTPIVLALLLAALAAPTRAADEPVDPATRARRFVAEHERRIRPLETAANLAWWVANTTGQDEDFAAKEEAQNRLDAALSDRGRFEELRALKDAEIADPILRPGAG